MRWKVVTFLIATIAMTVIAPYTGDPTWDYVDAPLMYSFVAEGFQIGENRSTPVACEHHDGAFKFTGTIHKFVVDLAPGG